MADLDISRLTAPIEKLRPQIESAYKQLDSQWSALTLRLVELSIPCTISFNLWSTDEGHRWMNLEWRKWKGSKRFCIVTYEIVNSSDDEIEIVTPFEEWSVEERVRMLKHIPKLFQNAEKQIKAFISEISGKGN